MNEGAEEITVRVERIYTEIANTVFGMITLALGTVLYFIVECIFSTPFFLASILEFILRSTIEVLNKNGIISSSLSKDNVVRAIVRVHKDWYYERIMRMATKSFGYLNDVKKTETEILGSSSLSEDVGSI